jgi:iron complex outermembrane recepter protein
MNPAHGGAWLRCCVVFLLHVKIASDSWREVSVIRESRAPFVHALALIGLTLSPIHAVMAQTVATATANTANGGEEMATVEITGSLIRSTERSEFNQVQVITAEDLARSGQVTVSDYLRDLAVNSASSWADNFAYGAWGGGGIALRGLSEKYTLVLVDGVRVAPYGWPSNGYDSFFDLNSLPLNLVERIEVVKTGAVSQYGSDAIGGVINIITRKDYKGVEAEAAYGNATHGGEPTRRVSVLGGIGDLQQDRYNLTATASYFLQGGYTLGERANTRNQTYPGGFSGAADYWSPGGGNVGAALSSCPPGTVAANAGTLLNGPGSGTACAVNTANGISLHPHEERFQASANLTVRFSDTVDGVLQLWDSRNITSGYETNSTNQGYAGFSALVPASNIYNPYGVPTQLSYTFLGQPLGLTVRSNFYRALGGFEGEFSTPGWGTWDWKATISHSQSTVDNYASGLLSNAGLANLVNNSTFDFADPSQTPNGLDGVYQNDSTQAISKLDTLDLSASTTDLFHLPAGNVGAGVGAQFLRERQVANNYPLQSQGLVTPVYLQAINGQRNVAALYYQVNIPLLSNLTFSQSSRYDHYNDFGTAFSPRFALSFKPVKEVNTYISYSRGFRAPTLAETSLEETTGIQSATDPYSATPNKTLGVPVVVGGNSGLRAEHTQNYNIGAVWEPSRNASFGVDVYRISIHDVVGTPNIQALIDTNDASIVVRDANGQISYVNMSNENLNSLVTDGLELTGRYALPTPVGTFRVTADWAYVRHFTQTSYGVSVDFAGNDLAMDTPYGASFPRWKGNTTVGWNWQGVDAALTYRYTGPYLEEMVGTPPRIPSYGVFDLNLEYSGIHNLTVYGRLNDVFDRYPPFDPMFLNFPGQPPYDPSLYNDEGRYVEVGLKFKFL